MDRRAPHRCAAIALIAAFCIFTGPPAWAGHLVVAPSAPVWQRLGADILLWLHIGGGTAGLMSGAVALIARKGGRIHRGAGAIFFVSMLLMSGIGAVVAPFLSDRVSAMAGFNTFYFIFTGWRTARSRRGVDGIDFFAFAYAVCGAGLAIGLSWMALRTPEHTLDGAPWQAFVIFVTVSTIAALTDLKVLLRRGITGPERLARHVWRMCFGLFVASGSLFLGQAQVFPSWLRHTPVLPVLALLPLPFLVFWMVRVRLGRRPFEAPKPDAAAA